MSLNLFPDPTEDNKTVSTRCMLTGYASAVSSMPINGMIHEKEEKGTQSDASVGCWLFGINLTGNCSAASPPEREPVSSVMVCSGAKGSAATTAPEVDKALNHQDVSKLSMKQKQVISEPSPKETQSKQGMMLSSRTRTKVKCVFNWFPFRFLAHTSSRYFLIMLLVDKGTNARSSCWSCCGPEHAERVRGSH